MKNSNYKSLLVAVVILLIIVGSIYLSKRDKNQIVNTEKTKIGVILPMTGAAASLSEDIQKSLKLYDLESKNIKLVLHDDQCAGKGALSAYNLLKNQGIKIYIVACSGSIIALAPVVKEDHNVILTGFGGAIDIRKTGDEVIRFIPDGLTIAEGMIGVIKSEPNKKYALFTEQQDYSQSVADMIQKEVGNQILLRESYKADDSDFRAQITKIKNAKANSVIFVPVAEPSSEKIYKQMKELGLQTEILGDVNVCDRKVQPKDFGYHGTCFATVLETDGYKKYLENYKMNYNSEPIYPFYNAIMYDVLTIVDNLLGSVGKVDNDEVDNIKNEILNGVKGRITDYQFTPDGEVVSGDYLKRVDF